MEQYNSTMIWLAGPSFQIYDQSYYWNWCTQTDGDCQDSDIKEESMMIGDIKVGNMKKLEI